MGKKLFASGTDYVDAIAVIDSTGAVVGSSGAVPLQSIAPGSSAVVNGAALDGTVAHTTITLVVVGAGTPTLGTVQLQGSLDGVNYFVLGSVTPNAAATFAVTVTGAYRYARAAITTAITGGTVTAHVAMAG